MEETVNRYLIPGLTAGLAVLALPAIASAQPAAPGQFVAAATDPHAEDDVTLAVNAGANLAYGNARSFGVTIGANFALRQSEHSFVAEANWAYGLAALQVDPDGAMGDPDYSFGDFASNANNFNARLRYDFYVTPDDSFWMEGRLRADPFAFLLPQVGGQAGYQRVFLREENHRFWGEIGLDLSYQNFGQALPGDAMMMSPANQLADRSIFAYKLLLGYTNEINAVLTYNTRFEVLGTLGESIPTAAVDGPTSSFGGEPGHLRFAWTNQFRSKIEDWLQISIDITARLDSLPPGQVSTWSEQANQPTQMFDLAATLNLVGNFDFDGEPAAEEAPPEEPACPACECPTCEASEPELPPVIEPPPVEPEPGTIEGAVEEGTDAAEGVVQ